MKNERKEMLNKFRLKVNNWDYSEKDGTEALKLLDKTFLMIAVVDELIEKFGYSKTEAIKFVELGLKKREINLSSAISDHFASYL